MSISSKTQLTVVYVEHRRGFLVGPVVDYECPQCSEELSSGIAEVLAGDECPKCHCRLKFSPDVQRAAQEFAVREAGEGLPPAWELTTSPLAALLAILSWYLSAHHLYGRVFYDSQTARLHPAGTYVVTGIGLVLAAFTALGTLKESTKVGRAERIVGSGLDYSSLSA